MPMPRPKKYKKMLINYSRYMLSLASKDSRLFESVVNKKDLSDYTILDYTEKIPKKKDTQECLWSFKNQKV